MFYSIDSGAICVTDLAFGTDLAIGADLARHNCKLLFPDVAILRIQYDVSSCQIHWSRIGRSSPNR